MGYLTRSTILIVNDTPDQSDFMCLLLQKAGYDILTASRVREGFEIALRECPDLVISDVMMQSVDGVELCRLIRAEPRLCATPVLLAGGQRKDSASVIEGVKTGADDYLEMPCEPMRLIAKVSGLIERKQAEELRRVTEERYQLLFDHNPLPMWVYELEELRILAVNQAAVHHYGYSRDEFLRMTIKDIRPTEDIPALLDHLDKIANGFSVTTETWRHHKKDGTLIDVEIASSQITWMGWPSMLVMVKDITEHKLVEKRLREREEQLRQASKMEAIGRLAGGIAHDFNNLLTAITGYSDLSLRHLAPNDPLHRNIQEIKKAGERAGGLTRQLLAFGRKLGLRPAVLDLNAIVSDLKRMLPRLIDENIEVQTNLEPSLWPVKADQGQIEQLIMNLSVNARDAMPCGGKLVIETANVEMDREIAQRYDSVRAGSHVLLTVSDTGTGMDVETQREIFEPFFTTKKEGKGTGLGLSIVYGIVKQSGGYISVESSEGKGTSFKIYLPRVNEKVAQVPVGHSLSELPRGNETILVVEDEELVRQMTRVILETSGYTVLQACHGDEAITLCQQYQRPIDLLVTDVVMPQMSGPQIARRLALLRPEIRVLYMSGYTRKAIDHNYGLEQGQPFIEKPFTPEALGRKVREVLGATQ
jgi:two-component system, cell cycle sensor histidine kinase and response regulator CckA